MESLFAWINSILKFVGPLSDFFWDVPTMVPAYKSIPLLGNFSLAIILLVGSGIYFSLRLHFIQLTHLKQAVCLMVNKRKARTGISPFAAFMLSSAMRVGPGNILGVTGAISVGGPGAIFWMWVSGFFGMATAFVEATLAQLFKEKNGNTFVGGLPFYGGALLRSAGGAGVVLSLLYIFYALGCLPAQGFNVVSSIGMMAEIATGSRIATNSLFYYVVAAIVLVFTAVMIFGGIRKVTAVTDKMVPVMAVVYVAATLVLIAANVHSVPYFFQAVFAGALHPDAFFGGLIGTAIVQGVKRGLMSNEAGQGTITMSAASADTDHPCEQGLLSALGVFLDTHIICTMTGFIVVMAHAWTVDPAAWKAAGKLPKYIMSLSQLTPDPTMNAAVNFVLTLCFCLFAYTCLVGMITFPEIASARISKSPVFITIIRILCLAVAVFGVLVNIAGYDLGNLWAFSDLANIIMCYANIPLLYLGFKYVRKAKEHFVSGSDEPFDGRIIGRELPCWPKEK
jgi:AGCS family alanine or glycine:cation symporter